MQKKCNERNIVKANKKKLKRREHVAEQPQQQEEEIQKQNLS